MYISEFWCGVVVTVVVEIVGLILLAFRKENKGKVEHNEKKQI